jgi:protein-disulfide isomerase
MKSGAAFVGFLFAAAVGFGFGYAVGTGKQGASPSAPVADNKPSDPGKPATAEDIFRVPVGTSFSKGPADALVTIVEFSDFQCPFCSRVGPTLKQIHDTYKNDVRVVFKHQPLPFHQQAPLASEYALAAGEQGKFWEMHDKLFASQSDLSPDALKRYASELGLDQGKIDAFVESGKAKEIIKDDQALAAKVGARGTPAFFINGVNLSGAQPFDNFKRIIDAELAKAEKLVASGTSKSALYDTIIAKGRESAPPPQAQQPPAPATRQKIDLVDGTPAKGAKAALVTIVEWSDFECPFCSRVTPTLKQIHDTYGDKVQVQFRHQPLPFHPRAMPAAKASFAAAKQGKFWEYHDKLFANQKALQDADLERYAQEIGLNVSKWKSDHRPPPRLAVRSRRTVEDGTKYGARGHAVVLRQRCAGTRRAPLRLVQDGVIDKEIELAEKLLKEGVKREGPLQDRDHGA